MKTRKVLEINACGSHLKGYFVTGTNSNPWKLYKMEWSPRRDGCGYSEKRVLIGQWRNFVSMMETLNVYFRGNKQALEDWYV